MSLLLLNHSHLQWPLGSPPLALLQGCPSAIPGEMLGLPCQPALCLDEHCPGVLSLAGLHRVIYPLALCPWAHVQVGQVTWGQAGLSQKLLQPLPGLELSLHQTFEGAGSAPVACPRQLPACSLALH